MRSANIQKSLIRVMPFLMLILVDQGVKQYISHYMMDKNFNLIGSILGFQPYINIKFSWLNSLTNLGISLTVHLILNVMILLLTYFIYDFIQYKGWMGSFEYWLFCFLFAGEICSFIDKLFWGGSLDYLYLKGFFIFDLKDVYITAFEIMIILKFIFHKEYRNMKTKVAFHYFKEYFTMKYIKRYQ